MAYASLSCLYHTIHLLLNSSRISLASSTAEILKSAESEVQSLQKTLQIHDQIQNPTQGLLAADAQIRDEARKFEDRIESEASAQFHSLTQMYGRLYLNLNHLTHDVDRFLQTANQMEAEYIDELNKKSPLHVAVADSSSTGINYSDDGVVGLSDPFHRAIRDLILVGDEARLTRFALTGMAGIGKTTFARKLFHDPLVEQKIECRAFVRVGHNYEYEEILRAIIAQLNIDSSDKFSYEKLDEFLVRSLRRRKFLIVLDDVWDDNFHHHFIELFEENLEGSFIFITSRIRKNYGWRRCVSYDFSLFFLKEDESWELLRRKVFGEDCPPLLIKAGKKIASNCEGLPLLIMAVAEILVEAPTTPEYWNEVADMRNSVFEDAIDQIYEVLLPSYLYLEQRSKACFLYMCVFPKDYVARRSRIISLWRAERFADGVVGSILDNIVFNNLVVTRQKRSNLTDEAKACNLHVVYRHLSKREAENNKFICVLNRYVVDGLDECIKEKRHLAIYHNTLLAIKEVYDSIASFVSSLRSVLCTGPYHQYQVPICLELKMLRVLDALTIRFYEFPIEVVKLIQLRYLSLTTNANLPPSISKLWFLEFLIVHQHLRINHSVVESYVPVKIWELQELEHLQIVGRNLPHPPPGTILPNLTQLLDVGVQTCAKGVLESLPKLEKLRIQIESAPDDAQDLSCFHNIFYLGELKSLRSSVMNPKFLLKPTVPPRLRSDYFNRYSLQKLSLSGFGYPWTDMSMIAQIRRLKVLKLQCYAFRGEKWDTRGMRFFYLKHLLIEDTDLARWLFVPETFPVLDGLTLKNCYKLQQISELRLYHEIQLVDCHPSVEIWAKQNGESDVKVKYTWK